MARIWANRLEGGTFTWEQVPLYRRDAIKAVLAGDVAAGYITAEKYQEITGEAYPAEVKA